MNELKVKETNLAFRYGRESVAYMANLSKAVALVTSLIEVDREPAEGFADYLIDTFDLSRIEEAISAVDQLDRVRNRLGAYIHSRKTILEQRKAVYTRAAKKAQRQLEESDSITD